MKAEEIKAVPTLGMDKPESLEGKGITPITIALTVQTNLWLKEIAYQLAVGNELKSLELQRQSEVLNT
jgi:hypothetical protein